MPANVTPDYERAERQYRQAASDEEKLEALRQMLSTIPKHKGTEKMQADIKRRISQLRKSATKKGPSRGPDPFHVPRSGAGQAIFVGPPNVGKSMLVGRTTNAPVKVTDYPYATAVPVPGMCPYEDAQIELVDSPPVTAEHVPGGLVGTIRSADIICVVVDAAGEALEQAEMVLAVLSAKGIALRTSPQNQLDQAGAGVHCGLIVANKADLAPPENVSTLRELYAGRLEVLPVSAESGQGLPELIRRLWELLAVIRVYTKEPGKPPDRDKPFTLKAGSTVEDLAREIHRELPEKMRFARIWGDERFSGQQVHRTEPLRDKDVVEIHE